MSYDDLKKAQLIAQSPDGWQLTPKGWRLSAMLHDIVVANMGSRVGTPIGVRRCGIETEAAATNPKHVLDMTVVKKRWTIGRTTESGAVSAETGALSKWSVSAETEQ